MKAILIGALITLMPTLEIAEDWAHMTPKERAELTGEIIGGGQKGAQFDACMLSMSKEHGDTDIVDAATYCAFRGPVGTFNRILREAQSYICSECEDG